MMKQFSFDVLSESWDSKNTSQLLRKTISNLKSDKLLFTILLYSVWYTSAYHCYDYYSNNGRTDRQSIRSYQDNMVSNDKL